MICLRQSLSPVNMRQLRSAVASSGCSSGRLLYQGHVDASEGMHPFELEGSKRKSTLAYIRHIVKYQVDSLPSCSSPCCHPLRNISTPFPSRFATQTTHTSATPPKSGDAASNNNSNENAAACHSSNTRVSFEEKELDITHLGHCAYLVDSRSEQQEVRPRPLHGDRQMFRSYCSQ